jgi:hypothetical protein
MSSSAHTGVSSGSDNEGMKQEFKQVSSVNTSDIKLVTEN